MKYDDVLIPFMAAMRKELHANSAKGDRPGWLKIDANTALLEVYWHVAKLSTAVKNDNILMIQEYSADVANIAMMVLDICGGLASDAALPSAAQPSDKVTQWQANYALDNIKEFAQGRLALPSGPTFAEMQAAHRKWAGKESSVSESAFQAGATWMRRAWITAPQAVSPPPTAPGMDLIKLKFFHDLVEAERFKVFQVFGVMPEGVTQDEMNHTVEARLFDMLPFATAAAPKESSAGEAVARVVHYPEQGAQFNKVAFLLQDVPAGTLLYTHSAPEATNAVREAAKRLLNEASLTIHKGEPFADDIELVARSVLSEAMKPPLDAEPAKDTARLDWLERKSVIVREMRRYGQGKLLVGIAPDLEEGAKGLLRRAIDIELAALAATKSKDHP